jgi:nicotinamidase-related amidase
MNEVDGASPSKQPRLQALQVLHRQWLLGSKGADAVAPGDDDIVLPKTSSGVFNSTNIEYLLRNIGIDTLTVTGFLTEQCVDHTVRDAADRGFYPVCVSDACATTARHATRMRSMRSRATAAP